MEYLKKREELAYKIGHSTQVNLKLFGYDFNVDLLEELTNRNISVELKESDKCKVKKFETQFFPNSENMDRESEDYKELISNIADEIEKSDMRKFDTLAAPAGIVINPDTYEPVIAFFTRYEE